MFLTGKTVKASSLKVQLAAWRSFVSASVKRTADPEAVVALENLSIRRNDINYG